MESLQGQMGELRFTLEIKRKETGKVEIVEMVGFVDEAQFKEFVNGSHPLDSSSQRSD